MSNLDRQEVRREAMRMAKEYRTAPLILSDNLLYDLLGYIDETVQRALLEGYEAGVEQREAAVEATARTTIT